MIKLEVYQQPVDNFNKLLLLKVFASNLFRRGMGADLRRMRHVNCNHISYLSMWITVALSFKKSLNSRFAPPLTLEYNDCFT